MEILLWIVAILLVLVGIAGTLLPMLPGVPIVFAGLLLAAWLDAFAHVGWPVLVTLGGLTVLSLIVDAAAASLGARRAGAGRAAAVGAAVGTLVGVFFGLPGILLGAFAGAALGQFLVRPDVLEAGKAGVGAWLGFILGSLAKIALAVLMVMIFTVAWVL